MVTAVGLYRNDLNETPEIYGTMWRLEHHKGFMNF